MVSINIYHLYPDHLNLYGDRGNMLALCQRAQWHGFKAEVVPVKPGEAIDFGRCDLLFMGGGQDSDQAMVARDLSCRRAELLAAIEAGLALFAVCGSYQLLGHYYRSASGDKIKGLAVMDLYTEAGAKRLIGNAVISCPLWDPARTLVGFENHAGKTYLGESLQPLGHVLNGYGNNGEDKKEGAVYKNVIGTYLHGSLLPKNPWLTDYLLRKALEFRGKPVNLKELDDSMEEQAHREAIRIATSKKHRRLSTRA